MRIRVVPYARVRTSLFTGSCTPYGRKQAILRPGVAPSGDPEYRPLGHERQ